MKVIEYFIIIFFAFLSFIDTIADSILLLIFFNSSQYIWFLLTFIFILIPIIFICVEDFLRVCPETFGERKVSIYFLLLLNITQTRVFYEVIKILIYKSENKWLNEMYIYEAFLESGPQIILQTYIMTSSDNYLSISIVQLISVLISIVSITFTIWSNKYSICDNIPLSFTLSFIKFFDFFSLFFSILIRVLITALLSLSYNSVFLSLFFSFSTVIFWVFILFGPVYAGCPWSFIDMVKSLFLAMIEVIGIDAIPYTSLLMLTQFDFSFLLKLYKTFENLLVLCLVYYRCLILFQSCRYSISQLYFPLTISIISIILYFIISLCLYYAVKKLKIIKEKTDKASIANIQEQWKLNSIKFLSPNTLKKSISKQVERVNINTNESQISSKSKRKTPWSVRHRSKFNNHNHNDVSQFLFHS